MVLSFVAFCAAALLIGLAGPPQSFVAVQRGQSYYCHPGSPRRPSSGCWPISNDERLRWQKARDRAVH